MILIFIINIFGKYKQNYSKKSWSIKSILSYKIGPYDYLYIYKNYDYIKSINDSIPLLVLFLLLLFFELFHNFITLF